MTGTLYFCGTGMRASQLTLESWAVLKRCKKVFAVSLPSELLADLRRALPALEDASAGGGPGKILDENGLWKRIDSRRPKSGDAALLFLGHPLLYTAGPFLLERCRRRKLAVKVLAGLSSADAVLAAAATSWKGASLDGCGRGLAMLNAQDIERGALKPEPRTTNVVVNLFKADWKRLAGALRRVYGPGHPASIVELDAASSDSLELKTTTGALSSHCGAVTSKSSLILPARRGR